MIGRINSRFRRYRTVIDHLGALQSIWCRLQMLRNHLPMTAKPFTLYSKYSMFPLMCRPHTSDMNVFISIFMDREYRCLDDVRGTGLIIDCGANVGYSSAYFLSKFPEAFVLAIEPDPQNFAILEANLAPFGSRYRAIQSAVWSHPTGLLLDEASLARGGEWARAVRQSENGENPAMTAVDIGTLLAESDYDRISILKMDIEGAESVVFSSNYEEWIKKVDAIVIELHSDECRSIFGKAISGINFGVSQCDELTVCRLPA